MSENGDKSRKIPCEICNKSINHTKLKNHIDEVHHGLKKFKCDNCEAHFYTAKDQKFHDDCVHKKIRNHKCETCQKSFTKKCYLRMHFEQVHQNVKKFPCLFKDI